MVGSFDTGSGGITMGEVDGTPTPRPGVQEIGGQQPFPRIYMGVRKEPQECSGFYLSKSFAFIGSG
jgi:hypothetical protein